MQEGIGDTQKTLSNMVMLQQEEADDYVLATGVQASVRDSLNRRSQKLASIWLGVKARMKRHMLSHKKTIVEIDPRYYRPSEVDTLVGDASKMKNTWLEGCHLARSVQKW